MKAKRVIVIGAEGLMAEMIDKFVAEGKMPNIGRLLERGSFAKALPSPPVDSATNWTTIATGAWTGTHGINSFAIRRPGEPYEAACDLHADISPTFSSLVAPPEPASRLNALCRAEFLWQAAARAGKRSILINWPGTWPSADERMIVVMGTGPYSSPLCRLTASKYISTRPGHPPGAKVIQIALAPAQGWSALPSSKRPPLAAPFPLTGDGVPGGAESDLIDGGYWAISAHPETATALHLLVIASGNDGYDRVLICRGKDAGTPLAQLQLKNAPPGGAWSDWLTAKVSFQRIPTARHQSSEKASGELDVIFRCRLLELLPDAKRLVMFCTSLFNVHGWAHPQSVAEELIAYCFELEQNMKSTRLAPGNDSTLLNHPTTPFSETRESVRDQCHGLAMVAEALTKKHEWDLLMVQVPAPNGALRRMMNAVNPNSAIYVEKDEEAAWELLAKEHSLVDAMIGRILSACADEETLVAVVSPHAALPAETMVWLPHFFQQANLTTYGVDPQTHEYRVDWSKTRAFVGNFPFGHNVWVNLKGRDPHGIVKPGEEYEQVRREVLQLLRSIRHPEEPVVALALLKEDAAFLGQWGDRVGDVVYYFRPGFTDHITAFGGGPIKPEDWPRTPFTPVAEKEPMKGRHHGYLPTAEIGGFSVCGVFLLAGPGIRRNHRRMTPIWMTDVAPTLAAAGGLPLPKQAEGGIVASFIELDEDTRDSVELEESDSSDADSTTIMPGPCR